MMKRSSSPAILRTEKLPPSRKLSVSSEPEEMHRSKSPDPATKKRQPLQDVANNTRPTNPSLSVERKSSRIKKSSDIVDGATSCSLVLPTTEVRFMCNVLDKMWAAERDGSISIRNSHSAEVEARIDFKEVEFCWCLLFCEGLVWAGFSGGVIRVYNPENYQLVRELFQHAGGVYCLAYNNGRVYSGSNDFECFQWNSATFEFIRQFSGHKNSVRAIVCRGHTIFTGSDDYSIRQWDSVTGEVIKEYNGHRGGVLALAINGDQLWSGGEDGLIKIWNIETGDIVQNINEHKGRISAFLTLGDRLWSTGVDRSLCCFNFETNKLISRLTDHNGYVNHIALLGQSTKSYMWSSSNDKTIRVWSCETDFKFFSEGPVRDEASYYFNKELEDKYRDLQERTQLSTANYNKQLQEFAEKIRSLETALQEKTLKLEEIQEELKRSQQESQRWEQELQLSQKENQRLQQELQQTHQEFQNCHSELGSMGTETQRITRLLRERDDLLLSTKNTLHATQQALSRAQQDINRFRNDAQTAFHDAQRFKQETARVSKLLQDETDKSQSLQRCVTERDATIQQIKQELENGRQDLQRAMREIQKNKLDINTLTEEAHTAHKNLATVELKLKHTQQEWERCQEELKVLQKESTDKVALGPLQAQIDELRAILKAKEGIISALKAERIAVQEGYSQLIQRKEEDIEQKDRLLAKQSAEISENGRRYAELLVSSERKDSEMAALSQKLSGLTNTEEKYRRETVNYSAIINMKEEEVRQMKLSNEALMKQINELSLQLDESKQTIARERQTREVSSLSISQREQELSCLSRKNVELTNLIELRTQELNRKHTEIMNLQAELQRVLSGQETLGSQTSQMTSEINELRALINQERSNHSLMMSDLKRQLQESLTIRASLENQLREFNTLSNTLEEYKMMLARETQTSDTLRSKLGQTEKMARGLFEQVSTKEDELRNNANVLAKADQTTLTLQERIAQFEKDREEHQKKLSEFEFVVQSRSELVRMIWELFCEITNAKKHFKDLITTTAFRHNSDGMKNESQQVTEDLNEALKRNKKIVSNFFTEVEKYHLGTSPYYFPPDEDAVKFRIADDNVEALRKLTTNDLKRSGTITSIRPTVTRQDMDKGSKIRSRSGPDTR